VYDSNPEYRTEEEDVDSRDKGIRDRERGYLDRREPTSFAGPFGDDDRENFKIDRLIQHGVHQLRTWKS
jgi:hypothetical protein